jgi:Zn-finger nucleic acid-binding protein
LVINRDRLGVLGYHDSCLGIVHVQIIAQCPRCGGTWLLDGGAADRRIRCKKCGRLFKVPRWDQVPKAVKVIRSAKGTIYVDEDGKTYG